MSAQNQFATLFQEGLLHPPLTQWLHWVAGRDAQHFVALPMIQRGAVWKPRQIIALWDSALRGMPIGSLMLTRLHERNAQGQPIQVRRVGAQALQNVPAGGGAGLADGQQRTLAMLLGWPEASAEQRQGRKLWIDLADKPGPETVFRLHTTSQAHPHGYTKSDPNARLSLHERRKAREALSAQEIPWDAHFPVLLSDLVQAFQDAQQDPARWKARVLADLQQRQAHRGKTWEDWTQASTAWNALRAVDRLGEALERLFAAKIPLIAIPETCFSEDPDTEDDEPALAILFKRIGTGGTALSDADYAYSVIKHHLPETFQLVESMAAMPGFSRLLGSIDVVMTGVRLVAAEQGLTDFESPTKANFDQLRKDPEFLTRFRDMVSGHRLRTALETLSTTLAFDPANGEQDPGLPRHGFILASRPVLQVLLRWLLQSHQGPGADPQRMANTARASRAELLRFVLYAHLAIPDPKRASTWAFAWLAAPQATAGPPAPFPGQALVAHLIARGNAENRDVARPLPRKDVMAALCLSVPPDADKPLRGQQRFAAREDVAPPHIAVFQHWWGNSYHHRHPLLLWLQRSYLHRIDQDPEEVRADDETPYDYDHLCPGSHCLYWGGVTANDRLMDFLEETGNRGHFHVGNSLGNLRVWHASDNRRDGDLPAAVKLQLDAPDGAERKQRLQDSAIALAHIGHWQACSGAGSGTAWTSARARAFQTAAEQRALDLYHRYFDELHFEAWFPPPGS